MRTLKYLLKTVQKMTKKLSMKIHRVLIFVATILLIPAITNASNNDLEVNWFEIMPKLESWQVEEVNKAIDAIWKEAGKVRKNYNTNANKLTTSQQIASWIMNRDTIMNYIVFVVQFLSQLWLLVWACFIMYAWYKYMLSVFNWWKTPWSTLKNAIIWVVIVVFSYAIMKILTSIIWLN